MDQEKRTMLENMYDTLQAKFHDSTKSWDRLIEFLAVDNCAPLILQINHKLNWLFQDSKLAQKLINAYDPAALKSDYYDHLGEMYLEKIVGRAAVQRSGQFLTPVNVADMMADMNIGRTDEKKTVLDPAVGSGRLLMAAHKVAPNALLFGVDIDLRMLRITYTNFAIHNISGYLLHADSLLHEIDISREEGRENWQYANRWYSCMNKLKPVARKARRYSATNSKKKHQEDLFDK